MADFSLGQGGSKSGRNLLDRLRKQAIGTKEAGISFLFKNESMDILKG